ncbi:MAG: ABC transporter permease [Clostridia bacterium]|nr:ABC transporter permease [Clostridia bacterium]MBQ8266883.1 ABC transporter permease [Clostridia bacterium]
MKFGSIKYLVKEGFKGAWANRLMSLASVGVLVACMVVIGLAILISENVNMAIGKLEQQNVVQVYLKDYAWAYLYGEKPETEEEKDANGIADSYYLIHNEEEALAVRDEILAMDNVADAVYVSREEGLAQMTSEMGEEYKEYFSFLEEDDQNPISSAIDVTMKDMSKFDQTVEELKSIDAVFNIQTYDGLAEKIDAIKQGIYVAGFWIIAILIVISLVIVSNTIRVTMYNRKLEISIMKAVGATDAFVRIPFVIEGVLIGLISALISEGLIYFCYRVATEKISAMLGDVVAFGDVALYLLLVFVIIGMFAGALGSVIMIGKYLKREGSEFTAI